MKGAVSEDCIIVDAKKRKTGQCEPHTHREDSMRASCRYRPPIRSPSDTTRADSDRQAGPGTFVGGAPPLCM